MTTIGMMPVNQAVARKRGRPKKVATKRGRYGRFAKGLAKSKSSNNDYNSCCSTNDSSNNNGNYDNNNNNNNNNNSYNGCATEHGSGFEQAEAMNIADGQCCASSAEESSG